MAANATNPSRGAVRYAVNSALLVRAPGAGLAEEGVEAVVRAQRREAVALDAVAPGEHAHHGRPEVVVTDPPRRSKATAWPSRNASWPSPGKQTWTARPECESRITNIDSSVSSPSRRTLTLPKSASASSPGGCSWGIVTSVLPESSSRRSRPT